MILFQSVIKTGRLIVSHEAPQTMGFVYLDVMTVIV